MSGRLGAIYGHKNMLLVGGAWLIVFTLINGFANNYIAFVSVRALSGIGGAMVMPNAVAMISITTPPGKFRNFSLGLFAASAPIGGWLGALIAGLFTVYTPWNWIFYTM